MRKFKIGIRRLGASLSAFLMVCCLTAPALASAGDTAVMPNSTTFLQHPFSWYVWKESSSSSSFELINSPLVFKSDGYLSYVDTAGSYDVSYQEKEFVSGDMKRSFAFPSLYELSGRCGSWRYYPSFPVGATPNYARVRLYPYVDSGLSASRIESNDYVAGLCPSPSYFALDSSVSSSQTFDASISLPMMSNNQLIYPVVYGPWKSGNSYGNQWFSLSGLDDDFFALKSNNYDRFISPYYTPILGPDPFWDGSSAWQSPPLRFGKQYSFPSSEACIWISSKSEPIKPMSGLWFVPTLVVPKSLLPASIKVGDWISKASLEDLQDQLVNDFDVNSDTLKNSKQNFDSWQNSNTIDTDVANTSLDIINGLMQNVGQFAFIVSLLCFGAVVLRVLIRKAVEG